MNTNPFAALPPAITKQQASGWTPEEIAYLTVCINHINRVLASSKGAATITERALKEATGKDGLSPKARRALVEPYRNAGWAIEVEDASSGTKFRFS
jgi:hypothetical protein